jgi:hypothetical protein
MSYAREIRCQAPTYRCSSASNTALDLQRAGYVQAGEICTSEVSRARALGFKKMMSAGFRVLAHFLTKALSADKGML